MQIAYIRVSTVEQSEARQVEAMEKYNIAPSETVMLGDKWSTDVLAAKFAKIRSWKVEHRRNIV